MVIEGRGRIFKHKYLNKYQLYLPKDVAEDTMFPFKVASSMFVKLSFKLKDGKLLIEKWENQNYKPKLKRIEP